MKMSERFIYIFIIVLALGYITYVWLDDNEADLGPYEEQIESLREQIKLKDHKLDSIAYKIDSFKPKTKTIDSLLNIKNLQIEELIKKYNETINNINTYSNDDIRDFFTNRYTE